MNNILAKLNERKKNMTQWDMPLALLNKTKKKSERGAESETERR